MKRTQSTAGFDRSSPIKENINPKRRKFQKITPKFPSQHPLKLSQDEKLTPFTRRQNFQLGALSVKPELPTFPNVICVEGNIGCGKSTLLKNLEEQGITVIQEPVNTVWAKYLPLLYSDPKRWGMTFQSEVFHWYHKLQTTILPQLKNESLVIVERSAQSSFHVFCQNMLDGEIMSPWEFSILERSFRNAAWSPVATLYLRAEPETCVKRIQKRNREGEEQIDPSLIQSLHDRHEELFKRLKGKGHNVLEIDGSQDARQVCADASSHCKHFQGFVS